VKGFLISLILLWIMLPAFAEVDTYKLELEIWELTNLERLAHGLPALQYDEGLADLARYHSANMYRQGYTGHTDREGLDVDGRARKYYPQMLYQTIGENIARYQNAEMKNVAADNVKGWMNSPGHRANILHPDYTYLGVGVVVKGKDYLATQNFATPITVALDKIPKSISVKENLVLRFSYLGQNDLEGFMAILSYPDPKREYLDPSGQIVVGAEPIPVSWNTDGTFELQISFKAGKGIYHLGFGTAENYLLGYTLKVN
jgi:hypothetical protein